MGIFGSLSGKTKSNRHPIPSCAPAALEALEPRLLLDGSPTPVRLPVSAVQDPLAAIPVGPAGELTVYGETDPWYLMEALLASSPGITVQDVVLRGHIGAGGALSSGVFVNNAEVYGMGAVGIVLSSGNVEDYGSGPNVNTDNTTSYDVAATAQQELLLDPITGGVRNHWDVTELEITFDLAPSKASISFQVVFGSEEYTEYVGSVYVDGFGLFVNGTNIASTGGRPVNINHPDMTGAAGTELDGILAPGGDPVLVFEANCEGQRQHGQRSDVHNR